MKSGPYLSKSGPYVMPGPGVPPRRLHRPANLNVPRQFRKQRRDFDLPRIPYQRQMNQYRNDMYRIARRLNPLRYNPLVFVQDFLGVNPWTWFDANPLLGAQYAYSGRGIFKECNFDLDWGGNTFYVDAGEVLGSSLTCLSGQAIFSQNFADAPNLHRNLWLMRQYTIVPGLDRSASLWVRHVPIGEPSPYEVPGPMPYALPGPGLPGAWDRPNPWNPYDPSTNPQGGIAPDPLPLRWRDAAGNAPKKTGSMTEYGQSEVPNMRPRPAKAGSPRGREPIARPPGRREKERKTIVGKRRWLQLWGGMLSAATETKDLIEAVWHALPKDVRRRYKKTLPGMAQAVYENYDRVDVGNAITNIIANQLEDAGVGRLHRGIDRGVKSAHKRGYWNGGDVRSRWSGGDSPHIMIGG